MADRAALGILLLVAVVALFTFRDYGLGWDDYTHAQYGDLLLSLYGSGFRDQRALSFVNLYMYGGSFDMVAGLIAKVLPFDLFETRRLVGAAVGLIGLATTWRLARRFGGPLAGVLALALLAACPIFYGHMFMNPKDGPFAVAMVVLLLRTGARFRGISRAVAANGGHLRHRARHRLRGTHPRGPERALRRRRARASAGRRPARRRRRDRDAATGRVSSSSCSPASPSPICSWALHGRGRFSIRSIQFAPSRISRSSSKSPGRRCSPALSSRCPTCRGPICRPCCSLKLPEVLIALALIGLGAHAVRRRRQAAAAATPRRAASRRAGADAADRGRPDRHARRCITASVILHFCCRHSRCSAASAEPGCWVAVRRYGTAASALTAAVLAAGIALPVVDDRAAASLRVHLFQRCLRRDRSRRRPLHARLLGTVVQAGLRGSAREAEAAAGIAAARTPLESRRLRAASAGRSGARPAIRGDLGQQGRRLRHDARRVLLRQSRRTASSPTSSARASPMRASIDIRGRRIPGILTLPPP